MRLVVILYRAPAKRNQMVSQALNQWADKRLVLLIFFSFLLMKNLLKITNSKVCIVCVHQSSTKNSRLKGRRNVIARVFSPAVDACCWTKTNNKLCDDGQSRSVCVWVLKRCEFMSVCLLGLLTCCAFIGLISSKDEAKASEQQTWTTIFCVCVCNSYSHYL